MPHYNEVIHFWFEELQSEQWWQKDTDLDREIAKRFRSLHQQACRCELYTWRTEALGRLAEIIALDQFSRNIYRDQARAFAQDPLALALAQEAVSLSAQHSLTDAQRGFLYMPYMHSESKLIHEQALKLFSEPGLENQIDFERRHKEIVDRFGRYPHRNGILGRESTAEELEFLNRPGSSF